MKLKDIFLALIMCLTWSTDYIISKEALEHFSPIFFTALRFAVVSLFYIKIYKNIKKFFKELFFLSFILVVLAYGFGDIGIQLNNSITVANVIIQFNVIVGVLFASIFLKEKLTKNNIIGGLIAFFGMLLVVISNTTNSEENMLLVNKNNLYSIVFLLFTTCSWPIYTIWSKKISEKITSEEIIGFTALIGSAQAFLISYFFEKNQIQSLQTIDIKLFSYILYAGAFGIVIPHKIWHHLIHHYSVNKVVCFSLLIPVISAIESILYFHEQIKLMIIFGGCFVLLGLYINNININLKNQKSIEASKI
jgi:O-acetylserine/cysteine efflux transporter